MKTTNIWKENQTIVFLQQPFTRSNKLRTAVIKREQKNVGPRPKSVDFEVKIQSLWLSHLCIAARCYNRWRTSVGPSRWPTVQGWWCRALGQANAGEQGSDGHLVNLHVHHQVSHLVDHLVNLMQGTRANQSENETHKWTNCCLFGEKPHLWSI